MNFLELRAQKGTRSTTIINLDLISEIKIGSDNIGIWSTATDLYFTAHINEKQKILDFIKDGK